MEPNPNPNNKNKAIETYATDMAETFERAGGKMLKDLIQEQEKAEEEKKKFSPQSARNRAFTYAGLALLLVGFGAIIFITIFKKEVERVYVSPRFVPLIFTTKTDFVDITDMKKDKIAESVRAKAASLEMPAGEVAGLYLAEGQEIVPLPGFLAKIESSFPAEGLDFVEENFFIGVSGKDTITETPVSGDLFFVIKTNSFVDIFPFFRQWEGKMFYDLGLFFQDGTSPFYTSALNGTFTDSLVLNKNARILSDDIGGLALMYIFVDDRTVVIAASYDAAEEAILRLSAGELKK